MSLPPSSSVKLHARGVPTQQIGQPPRSLDATSISGVSGLAALMKQSAAAECSVNIPTRGGGTLFTLPMGWKSTARTWSHTAGRNGWWAALGCESSLIAQEVAAIGLGLYLRRAAGNPRTPRGYPQASPEPPSGGFRGEGGSGALPSVFLDELDIEAQEHRVGHLQEELLRRRDPEIAHLEVALAPHPEPVVPTPHACREGHGPLHAADEHAPADREQHIRSISDGGERGFHALHREADVRVAFHGESIPHVAVATLHAGPEGRGVDAEGAAHALTEIGRIGVERASHVLRSTGEVAEGERGVEGDAGLTRDRHPALGLPVGGSDGERHDGEDHERTGRGQADVRAGTGPWACGPSRRRGEAWIDGALGSNHTGGISRGNDTVNGLRGARHLGHHSALTGTMVGWEAKRLTVAKARLSV